MREAQRDCAASYREGLYEGSRGGEDR
jgi:hypothetical protein